LRDAGFKYRYPQQAEKRLTGQQVSKLVRQVSAYPDPSKAGKICPSKKRKKRDIISETGGFF
jgi:hypothetical protein